MATLNDPGQYDCLKKLKENPDMPYFLLLASDPLAPKGVRDWSARAQQAGVAPEKCAEAIECAEAMEAWQAKRAEQDAP